MIKEVETAAAPAPRHAFTLRREEPIFRGKELTSPASAVGRRACAGVRARYKSQVPSSLGRSHFTLGGTLYSCIDPFNVVSTCTRQEEATPCANNDGKGGVTY